MMNYMKLARIVSLVCGAAVLLAHPHVAIASDESDTDNSVERIMVTGSRIARKELTSPSPITVIAKAEMDALGITDVGEALRKLPAITGHTSNPHSGSGNGSIQTMTLRGIEASNTLILLNGRRTIAATPGNVVDVSTIPFEAVQEIQVLKDGASAIYGSDAIAGVINIITMRNYDGLKLSAKYGRSGQNDADERYVGMRYGIQSERGNLFMALSNQIADGWGSADRTRTANADFRDQGGLDQRSGNAPQSRLSGFGLGPGTWTFVEGNSEPVPYHHESMGYNYHVFTSGANDTKDTNFFLNADYEFNEKIVGFAEVSAFQGRNLGNQAPPGTDTGWYSSTMDLFKTYNGFAVGPNQKYNPFGEAGHVARRFSEYGPRIYIRDTKVNRYTLGMYGYLGDFNWDLIFSSQKGLRTLDGGLQPSLRKIDQALRDECGTELDPGCVPLDVFGPPGSITDEMLDYINVTKPFDTVENSLDYLQASLSGPVLELPAGEVLFAAGVERRQEQASIKADISQQTETFDVSWGGASTDVVSPVRTSNEAYLEFIVPVLESIELQFAGRYSKYSDIDKATTNPKVGVIWQVSDTLSARASYSTGFRAPTIYEMYSSQSSAWSEGYIDPCDPRNEGIVNRALPGCASLEDGLIKNESLGFNVTSGGNPELKPEEASNQTLGIVFQPWSQLAVTFDYYRIQQKNVVFNSPQYVIDQAYIAQNPQYLSAIVRSNDGRGEIVSVYAPDDNIANRTVSGFDLSIDWSVNSSWGLWNLRSEMTQLRKFDVQDTADSETVSMLGLRSSPFGNLPKNRASLTLGWKGEALGVTYNIDHVGSTRDGNHQSADWKLASTMMHNMQLDYYYQPLDLKLNLGVRNLFDKVPPLLIRGVDGIDHSTYSLRGRFFYVGVSREF